MVNALTQKERKKKSLLFLAEFLFVVSRIIPSAGERPGSCSNRTQTWHGKCCQCDGGDVCAPPMSPAGAKCCSRAQLAQPFTSVLLPCSTEPHLSTKAKAHWAATLLKTLQPPGDSPGPGWGGTMTLLCLLPLLLS